MPQQPAPVTHVHVEGVRRDHEPLLQQHAGPVRNETVSLHLAQTEATLAGTSLGRLAGEDGAGSAGTTVHLVQHHVLQLLVVDGTVVDVGLK